MTTGPTMRPEPADSNKPTLDVSVPQAARRYDALLGGKDNFASDRAAADALVRAFPDARIAASENRRFMRRMVHHLAADLGVRQFLDVGVGLPAAPNVHDVAQAVDPTCRVVYTDNDPQVAAHARALLIGDPAGRCVFTAGDLRFPRLLLADPLVRATLDPDRPVAVLIMAVLHFIPDTDKPYEHVRALMDATPPGSYLALTHGTADLLPAQIQQRLQKVAADPTQGAMVSRSRAQVAAFADGMDLLDPGVTPVTDWLPDLDPAPSGTAGQAACYGLLAQRR